MAAVSATRAPARYSFFAPEREAPTTAVAGRDVDIDFVNEHGRNLVIGLSNYQICALLQGQDADDAPARPVILEPDAPGNLRKDGVVFAATHVQTRAESSSALTDDDRPAADEVAVVRFDTKALRILIAAVP